MALIDEVVELRSNLPLTGESVAICECQEFHNQRLYAELAALRTLVARLSRMVKWEEAA